jgi:DNA-binding PadR family transcriptional regulator
MNGLPQEPAGGNVIHSVLEIFILSLLDRGLETPYDLQRQGGLSLGSTVPALKRLETAGLVRKKAPVGSSKRPRHWFQLSAAGKKRARSGWKMHLKASNHPDFDAVLRVVDMAQHYLAKPIDIGAFLEAAASVRRSQARPRVSGPGDTHDSFGLVTTRESWDVVRLRAEAKFLKGWAKSFGQTHANNLKR